MNSKPSQNFGPLSYSRDQIYIVRHIGQQMHADNEMLPNGIVLQDSQPKSTLTEIDTIACPLQEYNQPPVREVQPSTPGNQLQILIDEYQKCNPVPL